MAKTNVAQLKGREEQRRLSKEELLQPRLLKKEIFLESLGGTVVLKSLSHEERQRTRAEAGIGTDSWDEDLFTLTTIALSVVEPQLTLKDVEQLKTQDAAVIDELVTQITFLNMLGQAAELKKGSSETQS